MSHVQKHMSRADDALKEGNVDDARREMKEAWRFFEAAYEDAQALHER